MVVLGFAGLIAWMLWPGESAVDPHELSGKDGKSRFEVVQIRMPANLTLFQRASWVWAGYWRRHAKPSPPLFSIAASPVGPCSIYRCLEVCTELTGTNYYVAVEIPHTIKFGTSNVLSGAQWVAAFESAIETSGPVTCIDFAKKSSFEDTLVLIREGPGVVKIVPRSKLADYQSAGLVKK